MQEKMKVADSMVTKTYQDQDFILKQGDSADYFYIIVSGEVEIRRRGTPGGEDEAPIISDFFAGLCISTFDEYETSWELEIQVDKFDK